ncbi:hypothetical protein [Tessaracoccus lacteus]|uniref:Uncharacterized protein n=1 Tax=Tessaracoccus lacteus TaxID=3041766 RepID=A0ABY8PXW1_9ACTN|nr:hypothetical protein [Tessaracoccus sp. T21]WGT47299.1 hypothetical protein QH948_00495 [Tessaracoccus sp. T21]
MKQDHPERDLHPVQRRRDSKQGLGTWFIDDAVAAEAVRAAVEIG